MEIREIWVRRFSPMDQLPADPLLLQLRHDDDVEVFLNGQMIYQCAGCYTSDLKLYRWMNSSGKGTWRRGIMCWPSIARIRKRVCLGRCRIGHPKENGGETGYSETDLKWPPLSPIQFSLRAGIPVMWFYLPLITDVDLMSKPAIYASSWYNHWMKKTWACHFTFLLQITLAA